MANIKKQEENVLSQDLIPLMNKLQEVFSTLNHESVDLPQIVVVGSQSSGKSSVLENIVQRDFLPRGNNVVTRRPLILQLVHTESGDDYAEFIHKAAEKFVDFMRVRQEIELETERVAGMNKGISRQPITLKIYSQKVLNLTLVDLPGIMKVPVGDQPPDIEHRIHKLVMEYISKPNALILAVSPANQDIVNSDALKIAREVDPDGKRTIGVLTKLDLVDRGTNAADILTGKAFPLKLGFTAVVNRSQEDIQNGKPISQALQYESDFLRNHSAYRNLKCGTPYLVKTLNTLLMQHIREKLPELKAKLGMYIVQAEQELEQYGDQLFQGKAHQGSHILKMLTKFSSNFTSSIDGTSSEMSTYHELSGGARLYYIFHSIFGQTLASINPCAGLSSQDIRTAIRNSTGARASLFLPEVAFDLLIKPQILKLQMPALRCVDLVFDELLKIVASCENKELHRFPNMQSRVVEVSIDLLKERMLPTQQYIESLISIQTAYINTNHPDFIGGSNAIAMLERKHDSRKKDAERVKRQQQINSGIQFAKEGSSAAIPIQKHMSQPQFPQTMHQLGTSQQGKDGGFLTYFFGQHHVGSPEPRINNFNSSSSNGSGVAPSRSGSPTRQFLEEPQQDASLRSDDGLGSAVAYNMQQQQQHYQLEREELEVELIRSLISSYFNIVRKTITDLVPKTIMHMIVNHAKDNIQSRLVTNLYKEELFDQLLAEDARVLEERTKCKEQLELYRKGAALLQNVFQYQV